jgi:hypothetical protein
VHHWLATNDINYSDGFTQRLWWISANFFIGIMVVVYLPPKDIVGNDVTSCIFLSWKGVCVYLCVCLCMHTSVCYTHTVTVS